MKTLLHHSKQWLLLSLLFATTVATAQATDSQEDNSRLQARTFDVGMFMGADWTINLMLDVHEPKQVSVLLRNARNTVLHQVHLRRVPMKYRLKFKFGESEFGEYQLEISDGQQTIVRRVEVVKTPTIESQRYITYGPQTNPE
ncbi:hypothetical protein [Spirosoma aerophilum]